MPRAPRVTMGGIAYHVLNRANARMTLFENEADYQLMVSVLAEAHERVAMRTLGWGLGSGTLYDPRKASVP